MTADFTPEQKRYLEGFVAGAVARQGAPTVAPAAVPSGPDAPHLLAQAKAEAAGKKLSDQEKWKRAEHPFDAYARFKDQANGGAYPKPDDNFRWRYHGLFYVAPAQDSYMCRLRIPNGILTHWQFSGVADLAERHGGGYSHVTTRANLQVREIAAGHAIAFLEGLQDLGLTAKGSGADNIRNVTGSSTAGIDPIELLDTRPYAREWHHHILNERTLYGLPRKFNVSFDGGGAIATLEDTNDIGFQAVEVMEGAPVPAGVWFRLILGGITGHKDLARDTGVLVRPQDATKVADAIIRVFIETGDRTNRAKSRMKYVLDEWGFDKYLAAVEVKLGRPLDRVDAAFVRPRTAPSRTAHIGVHPQKQAGLNWVGIALPVGKMTCHQMRVIASLARECGDGDIRLTVWQNLILSGVPDAKIEDVAAHLEAVGLGISATHVGAGLVACTGSRGCKFAAADTKGHALAIGDWCDRRIALDVPVNIHLTGCQNSCAQHYIGDIGLIGARVSVGDDGDTVDGYNLFVGGGWAENGAIGRELFPRVKADDLPALVERILRTYTAHRLDASESFHAFTKRHDIPALKALVDDTMRDMAA